MLLEFVLGVILKLPLGIQTERQLQAYHRLIRVTSPLECLVNCLTDP